MANIDYASRRLWRAIHSICSLDDLACGGSGYAVTISQAQLDSAVSADSATAGIYFITASYTHRICNILSLYDIIKISESKFIYP